MTNRFGGRFFSIVLLGVFLGMMPANLFAQTKKPNILVIFGDDIGQTNISAYSFGLVGYRTPNIDRIAHEGMMFTDFYAENSCTAGRSSFITGQTPKRTGMSKVGIPGAPIGLQGRDVTIAQALKPLGYATGQFGKNHLGDLNQFLPTAHGFDEFYGNLYHLNAEEEPERPYWPTDDVPYTSTNSPRGVLKCKATDKDDATVEPHWGRIGKQTCEDTGPLTKKRMETVDDETTAAAIDFMNRQTKASKPFFVWMNTTRMHVFTHVRQSMLGQSGMPGNEYADGMIEHDGDVGKLLKAVDDLGIANDTIVIYSTDNGPNQFSWPDAATTPFRSEKDTNWEGAFRVPAMIRWPGHIQAGSVSNGVVSGLDWFPTLLAAAGDTNIKDRLLKGTPIGGTTFKVHLDGYNQLPYLTGQQPKSARMEFAYYDDDGLLVAFRHQDWKAVFCEQKKPGGFTVWYEPLTCLRIPIIIQPANGSLRAGRHCLRPIRRLAGEERVPDGLDDVPCCRVHPDFRGVSAEPNARELHRRSDREGCGKQGKGNGCEAACRQVTLNSPTETNNSMDWSVLMTRCKYQIQATFIMAVILASFTGCNSTETPAPSAAVSEKAPAPAPGPPVCSDCTPVTADNFVRAESDLYFGNIVKDGGFGKFKHKRTPAPIDDQTVIRLNRDTLYSAAVFDLDAGPVTVTLPDAGKRFMSMQVINEDEYTPMVVYGKGDYTLTKEKVGTRYVVVAVRTLVDPQSAQDLDEVAKLQDAMKVSQKSQGSFDIPKWDLASQKKMRDALLVLASTIQDFAHAFGTKEQTDPVRHLIGAAAGWGGNPDKEAMYLNVTPPKNDGATFYRVSVKDVPVDGFWSISLYDAKGYFDKNPYNAYSINNITATKGADGSITVQFGGCDGKIPNCLPIMSGWNYTVRLYRPRAEILNGKWKFPDAQPVQ